MFGGFGDDDHQADNTQASLPSAIPWTEQEQLGYEKETLGLYWSGHPTDRYAAALKELGARTTGELLWQPLLLFERARWRDAAGDARAVDDAAEAIERADAMGAARIIQRGEAWSPKVAAR